MRLVNQSTKVNKKNKKKERKKQKKMEGIFLKQQLPQEEKARYLVLAFAGVGFLRSNKETTTAMTTTAAPTIRVLLPDKGPVSLEAAVLQVSVTELLHWG